MKYYLEINLGCSAGLLIIKRFGKTLNIISDKFLNLKEEILMYNNLVTNRVDYSVHHDNHYFFIFVPILIKGIKN